MDRNRLAVDLFGRYAQRYQDKYMDQQRYRISLDKFCDYPQIKAGKVLELGCGPGNVTRYLLQRCADLQVLATDLSPQMLALAEANNPQAEFQLLDCRQLMSLQDKFAGIVAAFVFPYLNPQEVRDFLLAAARSMQAGGVLYLSTMVGPSSLSGWQGPSNGGGDRLYMYYHEEERIQEYLAEAKFTIHFSERIEIEPEVDEPYDLVIVAQLAVVD